jgi:hypothetical protein
VTSTSFRCYSCKIELGKVSAMREGHRRLAPIRGCAVGFRETGQLDMACPNCGKINRFTWTGQRARLPIEPGPGSPTSNLVDPATLDRAEGTS